MADKPAAERTEQPTPKRLEKAREKGQTPHSQEFDSFASIFVLVMASFFFAGMFNRWCVSQMVQSFSCSTPMFSDSGAFISYVNSKIISVILITLPFLAALTAGAIVTNLIVGGFTFAPAALAFKFDAINPASGMSNLINTKTMVNFLISIVKLMLVGLIVWWYLNSRLGEFIQLRWTWSITMMTTISKLIFGMLIRICVGLLVIGLVDMLYQKWKYIQDMKMTRQEVKEERKQTEGSPEVKSRIRRIQIEASRRRMLQEVPKATVVLVNPTHVAVAIKYDSKNMDSPVLLAKGADHMSEQIKTIARAYGVPIISRPELARTIYSTVKPGSAIPEMLYVAVAEVLAVVYRMKKQRR
ncbi:MAG: flagellar biosynthesis protein FlhB [Phycisphaerae bacterium]|nr:flagellar biosynthesis protein FlhB [Phycisphaerae bacterium]